MNILKMLFTKNNSASDVELGVRLKFWELFITYFPALIALAIISSVSNVITGRATGWKPIYTVHFISVAMLIVGYVISKKRKGFLLGWITLGLIAINGFLNLLQYGITGMGVPVLLVSIVFIALFTDNRIGIMSLLFFVGIYYLIAYMFVNKVINVNPHEIVFVYKWKGWVARGNAFLFWSAFLLMTIAVVKRFLLDLIVRLRIQEKRYNAMLQNVPGVVYHCLNDEHWTMKFISEEIVNLSGYSAMEFVDNRVRSFADIIHEADRLPVSTKIAEALEQDKPFTIEYRIVDIYGNIHWVREKGRGLINEESGAIHLDGVIVDITDEKMMQLALRESEQRYRLLIENLPSVVWVTDESGKTEYISPNVNMVYGFSADEILTRGEELWLERIHPDDAENVRSKFGALFAEGKPYDVQYRLMHKNGKYIWLHDQAKITKTVNGKNIAYGVFSDITDRKRVENELLDEKAVSDAIINTMPGIFFMFEGGERLVRWNKNLLKITERNENDMAGRSLFRSFDEENREKVRNVFSNTMRLGEGKAEIERNNIDGSRSFYLYTTAKLTIDNVDYIIGIGNDISDLKRAETALREKEERYRSVFEGANDGIFIIDEGKFVDCNPMAMKMIECTREQIVGSKPEDFSMEMQPDGLHSKKVIQKRLNDALKGKIQWFEWMHCRYDKSEFHAEVTLNRIILNNRFLVQAIVRDITERKQAEEALRKSETFRKRVFETSQVPIVVMEYETWKYIDCNPASVEIYGFQNRDEVIGKTPMDVSADVQYDGTPSDEKALFYIEKAKREGFSEFEWRHKRSDGVYWDAEVHLMSFQAEGKELLQFSLIDITERKRLESDLRKSQANLSAVLESTTDLVLSVDSDFRVVTYNSSLAKYFRDNYGTELEVGGVPEDALPQENASFWRHLFTRALTEGRFSLETESPETSQYLELSFFPIESEGKAIGVSVFAKNITDRKHVERELKDEKAVSDAIINTMPGMFFMFEEGKRLVRWNKNLQKVIEPNEYEMIDRIPFKSFNEENEKKLRDTIEETMRTGESKAEIERINSDGSRSVYLYTTAKLTIDNVNYLIGTGNDITDLKRAEAAIRENEVRYRSLFEGANDTIFVIDEGIFVDCNPMALKMFECTREQMVGSKPEDFSPESQPDGSNSREQIRRSMDDALKGNVQWFEWTHCRYDKSEFVAEVSLNRIELNNRFLVQGMVRDITNRKRMEKDLRDSELKYRLFVENVPSVIWLGEEDGQLSFVNSAAEKEYNYLDADKGNRKSKWMENVHEVDAPAVRNAYENMFKKGEDYDIRYRFKSKKGDWRWMQARANLVDDIDGVKRAYGIVLDVSEEVRNEIEIIEANSKLLKANDKLVKQETAIRESEERFRQIANNIEEVFFLLDKEARSILYASPAIELIFGVPLENIMKAPLLQADTIHPDDRITCQFADVEKRYSQPINEMFRIIRRDGGIRWLRLRSFLVKNSNGEVYRVAGVIADVSESVQAQETSRLHQQQLIQADKMASVGMMVSGVAHEINNPNNLIMLNADVMSTIWESAGELLAEYLEKSNIQKLGGLPALKAIEKFGTLIDGISGGSVRIKRIVQNLKDFARLDTGEINKSLQINDVIETALQIVLPTIKKATKYFSLEYGENIPNLSGNYQKLEQVFINLITNACQSLESNEKKINVGTEYLPDDNIIQLTVMDEGKGISKEHLDKIFDPFFTTKRDIGGTGLGMSVSYGIIKEHNGQITIHSIPGTGTTVTVLLPAEKS